MPLIRLYEHITRGDTGIDDGLERREIDLAQRLAIDDGVVGAVVGDEVLGLRHHALALAPQRRIAPPACPSAPGSSPSVL